MKKKVSTEIRSAFELSGVELRIRSQAVALRPDRLGRIALWFRDRTIDLGAPDRPEKSLSADASSLPSHSGELTEDGPPPGSASQTSYSPVPSFAEALAWNLLLFVVVPVLAILGLFSLIRK
ncbi:MAG TPA: hypothetical protein VMX16_05195 [Terriglobia bacterium]|nr:hypothetical protein [Terriglobia bacterium]